MAKTKIRFGGPNLPLGTHTWYRHVDGRCLRANPGDVIDASEMADPSYYLDTGRATPATGGDASDAPPEATFADPHD